jgi:hypothetical protein
MKIKMMTDGKEKQEWMEMLETVEDEWRNFHSIKGGGSRAELYTKIDDVYVPLSRQLREELGVASPRYNNAPNQGS